MNLTAPPLEAARVAAMQAELAAEELAQKLNTLTHAIARGETASAQTQDLVVELASQHDALSNALVACITRMTEEVMAKSKGPTPCRS